MEMGQVILHMPRHMAAETGQDLPPFYQHLRSGLQKLGARVIIRQRDLEALAAGPAGPDFHFVHNGRLAQDGVLNIGLAYIFPFWYVDPKGVYSDSHIADLPFEAQAVAQGPAARFFARLEARLKQTRSSRYAQPETVSVFPQGCIAVFLQDWSDPVDHARHMTAREMLETVLAHSGGRQVVVKPHPRNQGVETLKLLDWLAKSQPQVIVSEANLHDILAHSALSVSISSAVMIEAMLHRVPGVVFGRTDFHHCVETVQVPSDWPDAMARALARDWPYEAFLFWFFRENCVASGADQMMPRVLARMSARGADFAALGLENQPQAG